MQVRGIRRFLVLASAAGLIASMSAWVGLKVGRPLYYSDGTASINSMEMRESGMLRWSRPEFDGDIPGPVRGRVIELPDGTLLYGLARGPNATDLVQFDPRRPGAGPRPVIELNSEGHDLAPVLAAGNSLLFASDRPVDVGGGFDIYRATYRDGVFFAVRPLPGGVNTGLDETDPAVDGPGGQLVFVRRDPELHDGRNGRLMTATLGSLDEAQLLLPESDAEKRAVARSSLPSHIDRDPFFAADAVGVYFVRETPGRGVALMRTFWHSDGYVDPVEVSNLQDGGPFRGPVLVGDGFTMRLVTAEVPARLYRAQAKEVYPYWQGQFWLEWLLLSFILFFGLLLILLVLGARWKRLDTLTKLLLLSMLIHLILILWLAGMEIVRRYDPRGPGDGDLEVRLVAQGSIEGASGSTRDEIQQSLRDVSRDLSFQGREEALEFASPGTAVEAPESSLANASSTRPSYTPTQATDDAALADEAAEMALRNGVDEQGAIDRRQMTTSADLSDRTEIDRSEAATNQLTVSLPGSDSQVVETASRSLPRVGERELPPVRSTREEAVAVQDAAAAQQLRTNGPEAAGAATSLRRAGGVLAQTSAEATAVRSQSSEVALGSRPPTSAVTRPINRREVGPITERAALRPGSAAAQQRQLNDSLQVGASRNAVAAASNPPTTRSESGRAQKSEQQVEVARDVQGQIGDVLVVGMPRSSMVEQRVRRMNATTRTLPERNSASQTQAAVVDDAVGMETGRSQATEQAQKLTAVNLGTVANSSTATQARRAEMNGSSQVVAPPVSDLDRSQTRRLAATRRNDPRQRDTGARVQALLADGLKLETRAASQAVAAEDSLRVASVELMRLERADASTVERVQRVGEAGQRILLTPPGSSLARNVERRALTSSTQRGSRSSRDLSMVQVLDDVVSSAGGATSVEERPLSAVQVLRPVRSSLPQDVAAGVDRPSRDLGGSGQDMAAVGIAVPGSFLDRAETRAAIVAVAKAELTPYSNRFGDKKLAALRKYGGDAQTERAVQNGLAYLARIQNRDGSWGDRQFVQEKYGRSYVGKTALCLLAFLGAGHTPDSGTEYSEVTSRAIDALLRTQRSSAHFGVSSSYGHGITTYALAECYALTKAPELREPLLGAVRWILTNQSRSRDRRNRGGWGYFSSTMEPEDGYSRSSTTAWQVMALESAKLSGIQVPDESLASAREFLLNNYDPRNRYFLYNHEPERLRSEWPTLPASTPAAVFCLQLLGMDASDRRLAGGLEFTLNRRPQSYRQYSDDDFVLLGAGNVYFWYYGSLACFMAGGETWDAWNAALKRVLLAGQSRDGSFRPIDAYAEYAGDSDRDMSYTTAMCVLSLEVYYRYFTPLLRGK